MAEEPRATGGRRPAGGIRRLARLVRDLWVIAGLSLVAVLLLDAVLRNVLPGRPAEPQIDPVARRDTKRHADAYEGSDWVGSYYREFDDANRTRWEPYSYWRRVPFRGDLINVDDGGVRRTWNPEADGDDPEVWVFGGSTVWGTGVRDDHTIPSELSRLLAESGRRARVTNFGEAGYVSTQEVILLMRQLQLGRRPDLVIFYDGVNDVYSAFQEGAAGLSLNESNRRREFNSTLDWSRLLQGAVLRLRGLQRLAMVAGGRKPPERPATLAADVVEHYVANLRSVRALAADYGFEALFFWQPTAFTKRSVTDFERRTRDSRLLAHRDLQFEVHRLLLESPRVAGAADFEDLSGVLDAVEGPLYLDFCHLSEEGNRRVARAMLPWVEGVLASAGLRVEADASG